MTDYLQSRTNMVDAQLRTNKVTARLLLDAFREIPREDFVPDALRGSAYLDDDLPVGGGRFLMEPMVLARLVQEAVVIGTDHVLNLAAGTGYDAAILARLAKSVLVVESNHTLAARATSALADRANVTVVATPMPAGSPSTAPFDVILISGAVTEIPAAILEQLSEGGRLVGVIRAPGAAMGSAVLVERIAGTFSTRTLFEAGTPLIPEFSVEPAFVF